MKWLLLSMMVSLGRGQLSTYGGDCSCEPVESRSWKLRCPNNSNPKFIADIDIVDATSRVECHNATSWSEFGCQSTPPSSDENLSDVTIERCPLPDEPFQNIIQRLGLKPAHSLTFTSHMNLSSTLTRRHLSMSSVLERLNLSSNGLTQLPSDLLRDVPDISILDLSFNNIRELPHDIFHDTPVLYGLVLSYNALEFVDWNWFQKCTQLSHLSLRGNLLTRLGHRPYHRIWPGNENIDLAQNLLETLPHDAMFGYTGRLMLDISGNRFSTLPEELFSQTKLVEFTMSHNRGNLTTLPMNFLNNLTSLEKVTLVRNNLTSLPENIFWGSYSLRSIELHGNALSTLLKDTFKDSTALSLLDLSENRLNYVPDGLFRALSKLRKLNLAENSLTSLSENIFENLNSLYELNLGFNKITNIHSKTFDKLSSVTVIRLSHNTIGPGNASLVTLAKYFDVQKYQQIFLDHNNLSAAFAIIREDYGISENLEFVDLSYNQIPKVTLFGSSIRSRDVVYDLRHNNLRDIFVRSEFLTKTTIFVDDNPLHCGCDMIESLKYMRQIRQPRSVENLEIIVENASCSEPDWMKGTPVASLRLETFNCHPDGYNHYVRCAEGCDCWWRPYDRVRIVDCSSRNVTEMPDEIIEYDPELGRPWFSIMVDLQVRWFEWQHTYVVLNLANNSLTEMPSLNASTYEHVVTLNLSHNSISKLSFDVLPPKLKTLHLDHNNLKRFDQVAVGAILNSVTLRKLDLEGNQWSCDSATRNSLRMMENKLDPNMQYSFGKCLDFRHPPNTEKAPTTYISYTVF